MRPGPILFAAFLLVPLIEIALFVAVGERIGTWNTVAIVFVTALIGSAMVARQGRGTIYRVQRDLMMGVFPAGELASGAMILVAGALLITPGFLTDAVGFALLVPPVRDRLRRWGARRFGRGRTITL